MLEYIFKTWVFVWIQSNYQLILSCFTAIIFIIFIGKKILGGDTFDKDKKIDPEELVKIYFAGFSAALTISIISALLISYYT